MWTSPYDQKRKVLKQSLHLKTKWTYRERIFRVRNTDDSSAWRNVNKWECQPLLAWKFSSHSAYFRRCASLRWSNYKHTPLRDSVRETTQQRRRGLRPTPRKAAFAQECHCAWRLLLLAGFIQYYQNHFALWLQDGLSLTF